MMRKIIDFILLILIVTVLIYPLQNSTQSNSPEDVKAKESTAVEKEKKEEKLPEQETPGEETKKETGEETIEKEEGPIVSYLIEAQLFPKIRKLTGTQTLSWRNTSQHPVDHLRFHLYYNAFRSLKTTFMQEAKYYKKYQSMEAQKKLKFGEIKIKEIRRIGGSDLTENYRFVSPDDNNPEDRTVMELKLEEPVPPGQILRLKMEFVLTIPQIFFRTGAEGDYFFMGQWFPKIGVLQSNGQWHCHQFHYNSEFFADYGTYRVWLSIPETFVVGATGNLINREKNADNTITYLFEEKNIHDFAWTAYPHFTRITETIQLKDSREATTIELLLSPGHGAAKHRYLNALKFAMNFFAQHIFPYPYKKITVVDPPLKGMYSGGMEYPTLITAGYIDMLPGSFKLTEAVTIHEFGHEYWYGIIGSDEFREAWLDEGVNSFFEMEIVDEYFKDSYSLLDSAFLKVNNWEARRVFYTYLLPVDLVVQYSWEFLDRCHYGGNVYSKAAIFLRSLKNLIGKDRMYNFFRYYAEKYKFKHPSSEDFIDNFNTFMNEDFSWAFDQFIRGEKRLDHAVHSLESVKIAAKPELYKNEVVFVRNEGYFPVEWLITLENGKEIRSVWRTRENWKKIVFEDPSPIKHAAIDPLYKLPLDRNFLNNSKVIEPTTSGFKRLSMKIGFFFQNLLGFLVL
ncbi:MAG: M1 family metallopeptidase [Candidatus Aminicenantes bacterium]|jgi:hypothetical protein